MKNSKGITLVALVITIIILLILAGIAISQLQNNGMFGKSLVAKEKYKNSQDLENDILASYENEIVASRDTVTIDKTEYENLKKKGKWVLLADTTTTSTTAIEVENISKFTSFMIVSYYNGTIMSTDEISYDLFKKGNTLVSNYYGGVVRNGRTEYVDDTHVKVYIDTGTSKIELYGIY